MDKAQQNAFSKSIGMGGQLQRFLQRLNDRDRRSLKFGQTRFHRLDSLTDADWRPLNRTKAINGVNWKQWGFWHPVANGNSTFALWVRTTYIWDIKYYPWARRWISERARERGANEQANEQASGSIFTPWFLVVLDLDHRELVGKEKGRCSNTDKLAMFSCSAQVWVGWIWASVHVRMWDFSALPLYNRFFVELIIGLCF